jgi:hypothetical protein
VLGVVSVQAGHLAEAEGSVVMLAELQVVVVECTVGLGTVALVKVCHVDPLMQQLVSVTVGRIAGMTMIWLLGGDLTVGHQLRLHVEHVVHRNSSHLLFALLVCANLLNFWNTFVSAH